jgi:hypothetical protein
MSSLVLIAAKVLGPGAAVVVCAAAVAGGEGAGLDLGAAELGGGALAVFLVREVFTFVKWLLTRKELSGQVAATSVPAAPARVVLPEEMREHSRKTCQHLEEIRDELRALRGPCPLKDPAGLREVSTSIAERVGSRVRGED